MANSTHSAPEWFDDWGGLHSLDDGHEGSYAHEAVATTDGDTTDGDTATLTCQCGEWAKTAPAADYELTELLSAWAAHVYAATGRARSEAAELAGLRADLAAAGRGRTAALDDAEAEQESDPVVISLRAELAAERERAERAARDGLERIRELKAERDHLAALLDAAVARLAEGGSV